MPLTGDHGPDQGHLPWVELTTTVPRVRAWETNTQSLSTDQNYVTRGDVVEHSNWIVRWVELRHRHILVNGKRVLFRGVNRHDHDPISGKTQRSPNAT